MIRSPLLRVVLFVVSLAIIAGTMMLRARQRAKPAAPSFQTTQELITYLSEEARDIAKKSYQVELDYSIDSIQKVDRILGKLHEEYAKNPATPGLNGLASAFGAYVGEVIRRANPGATWEQDHPVGGPKSYPLAWGNAQSFPMAWCHKRIINGDEDNIWFKYTMLNDRRDPAPKKD